MTVKGVLRGKTIELEEAPNLPDGQAVNVTVTPAPNRPPGWKPGDGIRAAFGAWSDDPEGLEEYLEWSRQQRKNDRPPIPDDEP